jgi:SAM-dependent methyltransferase
MGIDMMSRGVSCRSCGGDELRLVLSLGVTPLANALPPDPSAPPEATYPLDLVFCGVCALVQITETVPPEQLFRDYVYFSSFSDTMLAHSSDLVARLVTESRLGPHSLAVEVASNDGYLLQYYKQRNIPVLGIEPAENVAKVAREERGIDTISEFFGLSLAKRLAAQGKRADVLHANNVLAHVADLNGFVAGIRELLADDGVAVLEFPYVGDMVDRCEFDTIYHEHLCYFSMGAVTHLADRHGLKIVDVERLDIHGGSLLLKLARRESSHGVDPRVAALRTEEIARGMMSFDFYRDFGERVAGLKQELCGLLARLKREGRRIAAYGAAAKGSTLLNTFGIGPDTLEFVADRSTHKQGRYMPGMRIPIVPPTRLVESMPDFTLLLTWNFAEEILEQQAEYRRRGGKFIVPLPTVRVM